MKSVLVVAVPQLIYTWQVDVWLCVCVCVCVCVCACVWRVSIIWCAKWWGCIFLLWCFCFEAWKIIRKMEWPNEMTLTFLHLYQTCQTWSLKSFMMWLCHILIYSQTSVHEHLGSWTIRFMNKFSEHKASQMTYCVSSYEHASCQHRGVISWEYQCRQYS